jgi:hypothetical protein
MSTKYVIVKNALTTPPTFYPQVEPNDIRSIDDVAKRVNELNGTIPVKTAVTVIEAFADIVSEEVGNGNTVKIDNFISIKPKLSGSMVSATDPLPENSFSVNAVISAPFQTEVASKVSFEKVGVKSLSPSIAEVRDTNTAIANYIRENYGLEINGARMEWNQDNSDEGVFLTSSNAVTRQTNITYSKATKAFIVPNLDSGISSPDVEYTLDVRTRYTENGQLRVGAFERKLRTTNILSTANDEVFSTGGAAGPATLSYSGAPGSVRIQAYIDTSGVLYAKIGTMAGVFEDPVSITTNTTYALSGTVDLVVADYTTLLATVQAYGKFMEEICDLQSLT